MTELTIRVAYPRWAHYNRQLRDVVATLTDEQLAIQPGPGRWPLWATIGHLACQRVFGLCDVAGRPGAETTPHTRPAAVGDDDLEHMLSASDLRRSRHDVPHHRGALDRWTACSAKRSPQGMGRRRGPRRGEVSRAVRHDVSHILRSTKRSRRVPLVDIWGIGPVATSRHRARLPRLRIRTRSSPAWRPSDPSGGRAVRTSPDGKRARQVAIATPVCRGRT